MITLQELCQYLNDLLSVNSFSDFCPNGLQIEGKAKIYRLATAVSASEETILAAKEAAVDALIVHHGLFWQGDSFIITGSKRCKIEAILQSGMSLLAYHLPLDAHRELGNNWRAAKDLQWRDLEPFSIKKMDIGVKGRVEGLSPKGLQERLERYYGHFASYAPGRAQSIHSVALISGGAYRSIQEAAQQGVDAFITGNYDEPAWHMAKEEGVHFYALGHSATERIGPIALADHLEKRFAISSQFIDIFNPF